MEYGLCLLFHDHVNSTAVDHTSVSQDAAGIHQLLIKQMSYLENSVRLLTDEVSSLKRNRSKADTEMSNLKQRLESTEQHNQDLKQRLKRTEQQITEMSQISFSPEDMCNRTDNLSQNWNLQEERLKKLESDVGSTVSVTRTLAVNGEKDRNRTSIIEKNVSVLKDELRNVHLYLVQASSKSNEINSTLEWHINDSILKIQKIIDFTNPIGFTAGSTISNSFSGSTLIFNKLVYSIGGGYDTSTGVFTSPVTGVFVFYVAVVSQETTDLFLDIMLNGVAKVRTLSFVPTGTPISQTGTNIAVLHIQSGDRVWIKNHNGGGYRADRGVPIVTFSGFRL
ncbi:uncharacterized protein LOC134281794 [Saccostrea cucullata]|uniref:uncharacterized protein LOC134281794 n=1 Tax=Saccostrea cuccullata TaxID=36930 RepID=UPI002ED5F6D3